MKQGLPVGFLLLRYSVACTVESNPCFISFLYLYLYELGDNANPTSMCIDPHQN